MVQIRALYRPLEFFHSNHTTSIPRLHGAHFVHRYIVILRYLGPLVLIQENCNATVYKDNLDNCVLQTYVATVWGRPTYGWDGQVFTYLWSYSVLVGPPVVIYQDFIDWWKTYQKNPKENCIIKHPLNFCECKFTCKVQLLSQMTNT